MMTCEHHVDRGFGRWVNFQSCGKPAKGTTADGKPACGIHLAAERRRSTALDRERSYASARDARNAEVDRRLDELTERLGISRDDVRSILERQPGGAEFERWASDRRCTVTFDALEEVARELTRLRDLAGE